MRYSPEPHTHYVKNGTGPGAVFLGDVEKWNWRWTRMGTEPCPAIDNAINVHFNESQRYLMRQAPGDVLVWMESFTPEFVDEFTRERLIDAQTRLFPPLIVRRDGNIVFASFGHKAL